MAEIAAGATSLRAAFDLAKAMIGLRDAKTFRAKSVELNGLILEALEKAIEAREAQAAQVDLLRDLKAEIGQLKAWNTDKQRYELKTVGRGAVAYMLKPELVPEI